MQAIPATILDRRLVKRHGRVEAEVLVLCQGAEDEATWENHCDLMTKFPELNLKDKVVQQGGNWYGLESADWVRHPHGKLLTGAREIQSAYYNWRQLKCLTKAHYVIRPNNGPTIQKTVFSVIVTDHHFLQLEVIFSVKTVYFCKG